MIEETLILPPDLTQLEHLSAWIDEFCALHGVPDDAHYHLSVAIEEVVINAMKHGHCSPDGDAIRVTLAFDGSEVRITSSDTGIPFNPLNVPTPELSADIASRPIGGLGIHLVRSLMTSVRYERRDDRNWLYLVKRTS